jgi:hypothetical protein
MSSWPLRSGVPRSFALGLTLATFTVACTTTATAATVTPTSVLQSSRSAIAAESGTHVVFTAHSGTTSITEKIVADVSASSGSERVSEGSAVVDIRVTPSFAYVSGNSSGLSKLFGMSAAGAKKIGKDWVSLKASSSQYATLKSDVTLSSVTALLPKVIGTTMKTAKVRGVEVYVLKWTVPATGTVPRLSNTLTISANGSSLPLTETSSATGGTSISTDLSKWGEKVLVQSPPAGDVVASSKIST